MGLNSLQHTVDELCDQQVFRLRSVTVHERFGLYYDIVRNTNINLETLWIKHGSEKPRDVPLTEYLSMRSDQADD